MALRVTYENICPLSDTKALACCHPIPKASFVYIQVNMEICTHVSPWCNFSNAEVGISNPF